MAETLTAIFTKIGDWADQGDLYKWLVENQPDALIDNFYELYQHQSSTTSTEVEKVIDAFTRQGDQLNWPRFFVNMCASATAVSFMDNDNGKISSLQQERLQQLYDYLTESDSPVAAYGMQLIAFWVKNEARRQYLQKTIRLRQLLHQDPSIKDTDPAIWVAIARSIVDMNYPLPTDDPQFKERGSLISGVFDICAQYGWVKPCEQIIYQILENIVEYSQGPLFDMSMPIYQNHFEWIVAVCRHAEESGNDTEGIVSLWHAAFDEHGKPTPE